MSNTETTASLETLAARTGLETNELHGAFTSGRRRTTLSMLAGRSTPVDGVTIARAVAARETGTTPESVTPDRAEEVRTMLYHVHLPKLDEAGLIEYDRDDDVVTDYDDGLETDAI